MRSKVPGLKFTGHLGNSQVTQSITMPGCGPERKVNQGGTEHIYDDAGHTGGVPRTSAPRCPGAAVDSLAALSTPCLSRPSYPAGEGRPASAGHLAFPKIRVGQVRFPFKRDGLPSTHSFIHSFDKRLASDQAPGPRERESGENKTDKILFSPACVLVGGERQAVLSKHLEENKAPRQTQKQLLVTHAASRRLAREGLM